MTKKCPAKTNNKKNKNSLTKKITKKMARKKNMFEKNKKKAQFMAGLGHYSYIHLCNPCCRISCHKAQAWAPQLSCHNSCILIQEQHSLKPWL
jgi:hypothetical protein